MYFFNRRKTRSQSSSQRARRAKSANLRIESLEDRKLLAVTVWLDFGVNFATRLTELAADATVTDFTPGERTQIQNGIATELNRMYAGFDVGFTFIQPSGSFERLDFDETNADGAAGLSYGDIDVRNQQPNDVAEIYTRNFAFIVNEYDGVANRAAQLTELTRALAGTAAHELGHNFGLMHQDSFGDVTVGTSNAAGAITTAAAQNNFVMATGGPAGTGLTEAGREAQRNFGQLSTVKLEYSANVPLVPRAPIAETGSVHNTIASAQRLGLDIAPVLPVSQVRATYLTGAIGTGAEADFYSFVGRAGDLLTVNTQSEFAYDGVGMNPVNTIITVYGPGGSILYGPLDGSTYGMSSYNSGGTPIEDGELFVNLPLGASGTYAIRVTSAGGDTGNYNLLTTLNGTRFAELNGSTLTVYGSSVSDVVNVTYSGSDLVATINGTSVPVAHASVSSVTVLLGDGDDTLTTLNSMPKPMTVWGGNGIDAIATGAGNDTIYGDAGNDSMLSGAGSDNIYGLAGDDYLNGGLGADFLYGGDNLDSLEGGEGNDEIDGQAGSDTYVFWGTAALGTDTIGESGSIASEADKLDFYSFGYAVNVDISNPAPQTVAAGMLVIDLPSTAKIENVTGAWNSTNKILGNSLSNLLAGGFYDDIIDGREGDDAIYGANGNDTLRGQIGADYVYGDVGNDTLFGSQGLDVLDGAGGSDTYKFFRVGDGQNDVDSMLDTILESGTNAAERDKVDFSLFDADVAFDLSRGDEQNVSTNLRIKIQTGSSTALEDAVGASSFKNTLLGNLNNNILTGGSVVDIIDGREGNDTLSGGGSGDTITGGYGHDVLYGDAGDDTLYGNDGNDQIFGGIGTDIADGGVGFNDGRNGVETFSNFEYVIP